MVEMAGRLHLEVEGLAAMGALPVVMMVAMDMMLLVTMRVNAVNGCDIQWSLSVGFAISWVLA